eukprot:CAMPEP_0180219618 /NCGR_PEP_ID=MMETSP0987-20121128/18596_1 /TAXON_ID=697907 /ORGANISM="non described non described, Strain CCMP2293" /LENGTH=56 /DNA_ID=CAMNT_0022180297 /DNA_START=78 /DNA_END=248 /DNA_ORIENTATION=+
MARGAISSPRKASPASASSSASTARFRSRAHGFSAEQVAVSAYVGSSKNLEGLKDN